MFLSDEHWLGLNYIHALTQQKGKACQLRVDMLNCKWEQGYAFYEAFKIGNENELYRISLGNYTGNAGKKVKVMHAKRGMQSWFGQVRCASWGVLNLIEFYIYTRGVIPKGPNKAY